MRTPPELMSQAELDECLDALAREGREDTPAFQEAQVEWERRDQ